MTNEKIDEFSEKYHKDISNEQLGELKDKLKNANEEAFDKLERTKIKSSSATVKLSAFLGLFGAGSFYLGRVKIGILKVVFNVVVPLAVAMLFLVWLSPTNKVYYNQSLCVASKVYSIVEDSDEKFDSYVKYSVKLDRKDFNNSLTEIKSVHDDIIDADEIKLTQLSDSDAVKSVLDGLNLQEVTTQQTSILVKIGFNELLPDLTVNNLSVFKEKFTEVSALASKVLEDIANVSTADSETVGALNAIKGKAQTVRTKLTVFLDDRQTDSLSRCVARLITEFTYFSGLKSPFDDFYSKTEVEKTVEEVISYNSLLSSISVHLDNIQTKTDLSEIDSEITAVMTDINSLSSKSISAIQNYLIVYRLEAWIPGSFLIVDGIIILCWWIGEVFNERKKCYEYNYQKLLAEIN